MNIVIEWAQELWGRERQRQRINALERTYAKAQLMFASLKRTNAQLAEKARISSAAVSALETENAELREACEKWAEASRVIDPNAKCPGCGSCSGFLTHVVGQGDRPEIRIVNNCNVCKLPFISGEPVAGVDKISDLYQPPQAEVGRR